MKSILFRFTFLVLGLALFGAGCMTGNSSVPLAPSPTPVAPAPDIILAEPSPTGPGAAMSCPQTPQVFYFNKLAFSSAELSSIQTNVVQPLIDYYDGLAGQSVVSIVIRRTSTGISVEAVIDQPDTDEPVFNSFIHPRTGSSYPLWVPEAVPPGYAG